MPPSHYVDFRVLQFLHPSTLQKTSLLNSVDLVVEQHEKAAFSKDAFQQHQVCVINS